MKDEIYSCEEGVPGRFGLFLYLMVHLLSTARNHLSQSIFASILAVELVIFFHFVNDNIYVKLGTKQAVFGW
jgi:hypothetical protein